jgi:hypothetical protein
VDEIQQREAQQCIFPEYKCMSFYIRFDRDRKAQNRRKEVFLCLENLGKYGMSSWEIWHVILGNMACGPLFTKWPVERGERAESELEGLKA